MGTFLVAVLCALLGFAPEAFALEFEPVAPDLYLWRDSANVYVVRNGSAAVLIDLGSGHVLDVLDRIGVSRVEAVLITHRDRDQWFGHPEAERRGIPIHAPATDAETGGYTAASIRRYWKTSFPVPNSRFVYSMVTRPTDYPQVDVRPGTPVRTGVAEFRVLPIPGHTTDQVAYLADLGGRLVAFTGDLIYAPGKVWQGFQLDWDHWRGLGYEAAFGSLLRLKDEHPDLVLPSHGEPMRGNLDEKLMLTADRVWRAGKLKNFELFAISRRPPITETRPLRRLESRAITLPSGKKIRLERLSERLWVAGNNYFLVSGEGVCFAVDNNLAPEDWQPILERIGASGVEFLWVTHLHSDHTLRLPEIRRRYGAKILTVRPLADLLERPWAYLHPYAAFDGVKPDRVLEDGEEFEWQGLRFRAHFAPGQTWFHAFLETTIDGRRAVFSGDSFYPVRHWDIADGTGGWSGLNRGFPEYHARSARLMIDIRPQWVLAEHNKAFWFDDREWRLRVRWAEQAAEALDALSPSGDHRYDFNPHVFAAYPLITRAAEGAVELRVDNPFDEPMRVEYRVRGDAPAAVAPSGGEFVVPARSAASRRLEFRLREARPGRRYVIPIEITARGRYLGPAVFFLADVPETGLRP